jgi:hypothetical protein
MAAVLYSKCWRVAGRMVFIGCCRTCSIGKKIIDKSTGFGVLVWSCVYSPFCTILVALYPLIRLCFPWFIYPWSLLTDQIRMLHIFTSSTINTWSLLADKENNETISKDVSMYKIVSSSVRYITMHLVYFFFISFIYLCHIPLVEVDPTEER